MQTSLFTLAKEEVAPPEDNEIEDAIKEINPLEMTPLEALTFLCKLKEKVNNNEK